MRTLLLALLLPAVAAAQEPTSREFKLLLDDEQLADWDTASREYWALVEGVALSRGVGVRPLSWETKRRQVVYLDTPGQDLRAHRYSLRRTTDLLGKKDRPAEISRVGLKYRSSELLEVSDASLQVKRFTPEIELEVDVGYDPEAPDGLRVVYAKQGRFDTDWVMRPKLSAWGRFFPDLLDLGLPGDTPVRPVNGRIITEESTSPAMLDFGDIVAKVDLILWTDAEDQPLVGELSFDHLIRGTLPVEANQAIQTFFVAVAEASGPWLADGATKTSFTYDAPATGSL